MRALLQHIIQKIKKCHKLFLINEQCILRVLTLSFNEAQYCILFCFEVDLCTYLIFEAQSKHEVLLDVFQLIFPAKFPWCCQSILKLPWFLSPFNSRCVGCCCPSYSVVFKIMEAGKNLCFPEGTSELSNSIWNIWQKVMGCLITLHTQFLHFLKSNLCNFFLLV